MPSFKCRDIGMQCNFEIKDENQDELMAIVAVKFLDISTHPN